MDLSLVVCANSFSPRFRDVVEYKVKEIRRRPAVAVRGKEVATICGARAAAYSSSSSAATTFSGGAGLATVGPCRHAPSAMS